MIATYGAGVSSLPFETYFKLWLNLPRQRLRRAVEHALGAQAVSSNDDLGREWAEALASSPEEVDEIAYKMRESRRDARMAAKRGW